MSIGCFLQAGPGSARSSITSRGHESISALLHAAILPGCPGRLQRRLLAPAARLWYLVWSSRRLLWLGLAPVWTGSASGQRDGQLSIANIRMIGKVASRRVFGLTPLPRTTLGHLQVPIRTISYKSHKSKQRDTLILCTRVCRRATTWRRPGRGSAFPIQAPTAANPPTPRQGSRPAPPARSPRGRWAAARVS
jgi:hypothetical protein